MNLYHLIYYYLYQYFNRDFIDNHSRGNNIRPIFTIGIACWLYMISILHYFIRFNTINLTDNKNKYIFIFSSLLIVGLNYIYFNRKNRYIKIYEKYYKYKNNNLLKILCISIIVFPILVLFPIMVKIFR